MALAIASVGSLGNAKTGTTFGPAAPAGVASGSLVIVAVMGYAVTLTSAPTIDNFIAGPVSASAMNAFGFQFKVWWFYKYATGADTGNYAGHMVSGNAMMAYAFRVSGWTPTSGSPFVDSLHEGSADGAAATIASWTPGGANSLLAMIMLDSGANYPATWTKNINSTDLDGDTITLASTVQTTAAATGALTVGNVDGTIASAATLRIPATGTNYTANPADSEGLTDSVTAAIGGQQSIGDAEPMSDAVTVVRTVARTAADTLGGTDAVRAVGPVSFITSASADGRHFLDQNGNAILLKGDSPWSAFTDLSVAQFDTWCADRAAKGFNAAQVSFLGNTANGAPSNDGATFDGILPFSDLSLFTPNPTYWARIDQFVATAASYGITLFVFAVDGWVVNATDGVVRNMTLAQAQAYGSWVASRYLSSPNIAWMAGGDYYATDSSSIMQSVLTGLKATDPSRLNSLEGLYQRSYAREWQNWKNRVTFDFVYSRLPTYEAVRKSYGLATPMPTTLGEGIYDGMYQGGTTAQSELVCRMQIGWTLTSGAAGDFYGTQDWEFLTGWATRLNRNSAFQAQYMRAAFEKRAWTKLAPSSTFITSGGGTPYVFPNEPPANTDPSMTQTDDAAAPSSAANPGTMHTHTVASGAVSADGKIAAVYLPTQRQITVNTSALGASPTATWVDPLTGTESAGSMANLTPPAAGDWLLFIESAGTDYTANPVDPEALTDTVGSTLLGARGASDAAAGTDTASTTMTIGRATDDPAGLTDTALAALDGARVLDDGLPLTDDAETMLDLGRAVADAVAATDAVVTELAVDQLADDPEALSDTVAVLLELDRQMDDPAGLTDQVTVQLISAGSAMVGDTEPLTDTVDAAILALRQVGDEAMLTDLAVVLQQFVRSPADPLRLTDQVTAVISGGGTIPPDVNVCGWLEPRTVSGSLGGRTVAGTLNPQEDCW